MAEPPVPSSFDQDPDFYNEKRFQKFTRRLKEEPLIPIGCAVTLWALFSAGRSIRRGNSAQTNKYFRYRLYAQGFTIVAMLGGSVYYNADRLKRSEYTKLKKQRDSQAKRDAWIRELEARDEEDKEWRAKIGRTMDAEKQAQERKELEDLKNREAQEKRAKKIKKIKTAEAKNPDDGDRYANRDDDRGFVAALRKEAMDAKKNETAREDEEQEMASIAAEVRKNAEQKKQQPQGNEKPKSILGETEAGGLLGLGHLKSLWNSRKGNGS